MPTKMLVTVSNGKPANGCQCLNKKYKTTINKM